MRRMADWDFGRAATWAGLLAAHGQWVVNYNYQDHSTHRHRDEAARSPAAVLSWVHGRAFAPEELRRVFYATRFGRTVIASATCGSGTGASTGSGAWPGNAPPSGCMAST